MHQRRAAYEAFVPQTERPVNVLAMSKATYPLMKVSEYIMQGEACSHSFRLLYRSARRLHGGLIWLHRVDLRLIVIPKR